MILPGINIQYPISEDIISGKKTIETRTYNLPLKYLNKEMFLIETPGPSGKFKARITGIIKFTEIIRYKNAAEFYSDISNHLVEKSSPWAWKDKAKLGWKVQVVKQFSPAIPAPSKRGIIFTSKIKISLA